jgi:hypothetical protein
MTEHCNKNDWALYQEWLSTVATMYQNNWSKLENSWRFIRMAERTMKMTESRKVVGICGRSAQSEPRRLDWDAAWTRGAGQHGARTGQRGARVSR